MLVEIMMCKCELQMSCTYVMCKFQVQVSGASVKSKYQVQVHVNVSDENIRFKC